jgi:hypothetical protein
MRHFTTPDQSRRLLELGLLKNSADCYYDMYKMLDDTIIHVMTANEKDIAAKTEAFWHFCYPCWSLGQLLEIASKCGSEQTITFDADSDDTIEDLIYVLENECDLSKLKCYESRR